jgi:hypothetical protein
MTRPLQALRVGNFKAFADSQRIPLKPITLIFGPNSAGKSSFIHSLALAHEAQFGREKRSLSRLDVHHTDVGGNAIDLGGFRQFVHRGQLNKRVEWGAELRVSALKEGKGQRLAQLLAPVSNITLNFALGIELDDQDRPKFGAEPRVDSIEISGDGVELLRMSHRPVPANADSLSSYLRLDRLASDHPVFRQVIKAIVENRTTSEEIRPEDFDGIDETISKILPELVIRVDQFFPSNVELSKSAGEEMTPINMLFPVSKANRQNDLAAAVWFILPRTLNDLIKGLSDALADELKQLQYLGPLRSFPPRHLAFAENEDANWYAGGGYAWDVVRRDDAVRDSVNGWLGSNKLKTPYKLVVRSLQAIDQLHEPLATALGTLPGEIFGLKAKYIDQEELETVTEGVNVMAHDVAFEIESIHPEVRDADLAADHLIRSINSEAQDGLRELVLIDQRTKTVVTHRDVGIGISQVLPVLVMAYGSQGKLLAMEQPEIHLHPALQAELGDVFIEAALGSRKNTFILETHSEHLILRLMRRMRETFQKKETGLPALTPADVSILYIEPMGSGSIVREMPLNEMGDLMKSWPGGFFEEGLKEQFGDA